MRTRLLAVFVMNNSFASWDKQHENLNSLRNITFIAGAVCPELNIYIIIWNRVASLVSLCVCSTYIFVALSTVCLHFLEARGLFSFQISVISFLPLFMNPI